MLITPQFNNEWIERAVFEQDNRQSKHQLEWYLINIHTNGRLTFNYSFTTPYALVKLARVL